MEKPWYIEEYEEKDYLHGVKLELNEFKLPLPDHRHCELCWGRISAYDGDSHFGYYEPCSQSWICESCYKSLKDLFKWITD